MILAALLAAVPLTSRPAAAADVALVLLTDMSGSMAVFYRQYVIGGAGSFLIEASDYSAYGEALKRNQLRELIAGGDTEEAAAPVDESVPATIYCNWGGILATIE